MEVFKLATSVLFYVTQSCQLCRASRHHGKHLVAGARGAAVSEIGEEISTTR
jgi:hypothetical protein